MVFPLCILLFMVLATDCLDVENFIRTTVLSKYPDHGYVLPLVLS